MPEHLQYRQPGKDGVAELHPPCYAVGGEPVRGNSLDQGVTRQRSRQQGKLILPAAAFQTGEVARHLLQARALLDEEQAKQAQLQVT